MTLSYNVARNLLAKLLSMSEGDFGKQFRFIYTRRLKHMNMYVRCMSLHLKKLTCDMAIKLASVNPIKDLMEDLFFCRDIPFVVRIFDPYQCKGCPNDINDYEAFPKSVLSLVHLGTR